MKVTFLGAAKTVTGSNHLVEAAGKKFLVDLGMYQGKITEEISENFVGKKCKILVEGLNDKYRTKTYCGRTDSGRLVNIVTDKELIGKTVNVVITKHNSATLWGNLIDE